MRKLITTTLLTLAMAISAMSLAACDVDGGGGEPGAAPGGGGAPGAAPGGGGGGAPGGGMN